MRVEQRGSNEAESGGPDRDELLRCARDDLEAAVGLLTGQPVEGFPVGQEACPTVTELVVDALCMLRDAGVPTAQGGQLPRLPGDSR